MELKKYKEADLERRRPWFFLIGLLLVSSLIWIAMELSFSMAEHLAKPLQDSELDLEMLMPIDNTDNMMAVPNMQKEELVSSERIEIRGENSQGKSEESRNKGEQLKAAVKFDFENNATIAKELEKLKEAVADDKPIDYHLLDELPLFPGGMSALVKYYTDKLEYPTLARRNNVQGKVAVEFVINLDGTVSDIKIKNSADYSLDREVMRVTCSMPRWERSGRYKGKPCKTLFIIPIEFGL